MCELVKTICGRSFRIVKSSLKFRYLSIATLLTAAILPSLIAAPAYANPGLTVSNAQIVTNVTPGEMFTQSFTVAIGSADPAMNITVQIDGAAQALDGTYRLLNAADDTGPYSARTFITVDNSSFLLQPGGSQVVTATVQVPEDVGTGTRYAIIHFATPPQGTGNIGIITAIDVPVYITIKGSQFTQTGTITGITAGTITNGQPINITTSFQNTGNTYFKVEGQTSVINDQGVTLDTVPIPLTSASIIPGIIRNLDAVYTPSGSLAPGTYTIRSLVMSSDSILLDKSTSTFTIKAPYVPPPALGTVSLASSGASTLKNTDGTISIYFPIGAAAIPVDISLNNIAAAQLPVAPTGFTLTGSSFQVNGLTGLLAKNATVTLKYSADDLTKASGKTSSLKLMRWDPGTNKWVVLKTKVNVTAMTLTATSKQMGIWAVAAGTVRSSGINWIMIGIIAAVIVVIGIVVVLLAAKRKPKGKPAKS